MRTPTGGAIDRSKRLRFTWEGRSYEGYEGDTLASALLANGVRVVGRSFKYHRPRGIIAAGTEESNALIQLGEGARSTPNVRATEIKLYDGLVARPVNCWPNARYDIGGLIGLAARFLPAGFYYKTFMWPSWHLYEGFIRRAAGLGRAASEPDPDRYESRFAHCDVLVVGAGPSGLASARAAAASGARVILVEQDSSFGGALHNDEREINGRSGVAWANITAAELATHGDVKLLLRTTAVGYHDHNSVTLIEQMADENACAADPGVARYRTWLVRAKHIVLATGAIERPLVFPGNDLPGVMLASAARLYARRFAVRPGEKAVIFTNNDDAYRTASELAQVGTRLVAVVDVRSDVREELVRLANKCGAQHVAGGTIVQTRGRKGLSGVKVRDKNGERWLDCDHLSISGGYNPTVHLFSQSGGRLRFDDALCAYVPDRSVQDERTVGAARGVYALSDAISDGAAAGLKAALACGYADVQPAVPFVAEEGDEAPIQPCWSVKGKGKAFVDFQNDVTTDDIALSARENFQSVEHLKRFTTLGMAPDQGKTSNVNAIAIMASLTRRSIERTGHTRYRFPFTPVALGAFAGRNRHELFRPLRRLPAHRLHAEAGAICEDFGGWMRPAAYPQPGETRHEAELREAKAVRTAAGLFDGSPLGKIEVKGADASRFLDLIYANTMSTLKVGKVRYGLMLNEHGVVIDDGVATRLGDDHFLVGTSSGGADRIAAWMEEWLQCEWLNFDVLIAPVTTAWGVVTLTGPAAKAILRTVGTDIDLDAFPHMSFAHGQVAGHPARIFRVSYTGETSYEINLPARRTVDLWRLIMKAGAADGIMPVGIDAWDALRTEKGYLHIGADTDGTTTALDVGWGHILKKSNDFVGKRSLLRPHDRSDDRLNFVGLASDAGSDRLPIGAHLIDISSDIIAGSDGYVTSSTFSDALGHPVALGMVRKGRARTGERVRLTDGQRSYIATIVEPQFYDKNGERLRG